ncbi:hypothetical protein NQ315_003839 [Exocentrus adspersus]|uniref:Sushi domain-containing protein n=1 Tax=Exocentrus adspersus TaxID=1586481 RepID=A0AAV8W062_9CUCU|nr:hypothetical protein NQ315_003839 [Exocentrus adspersus]
MSLPTTILFCILIKTVLCNDEDPFWAPYDDVMVDNNNDNSTEILCPQLEKISNGNIMIEKLTGRKKVATITCEHGYDIEGNNIIYCVDGQWEIYNSLPQCNRRCLPPPYLENGALEIEGEKDVDGSYRKGTVASYSCSNGYELMPRSSNMRVCEKGVWTGPVATCVPNVIQVIGCPMPKTIDNGYFVQENTEELEGYSSFGQRLHYNCKAEYSLRGPRVRQCLEDGSWSPKLQPDCVSRDGKS